MTFRHFSNFCRKRFPGLIKEISCTYWMNVEVLPHNFCKSQPPKLYKNVQELYCQAGKLFLQKFKKWQNVMLRQSRGWASRASPTQKSQGLRVGYSKNFSGATFVVFWGTHLVDRYLSYLSVKQIWRKSAVWSCCKRNSCMPNPTRCQYPLINYLGSKTFFK